MYEDLNAPIADLTNEELADFVSKAAVQLEPGLTKQLVSLVSEVIRRRTQDSIQGPKL